MLLFTIAIDIFFPLGIASSRDISDLALSAGLYLVKIVFIAFTMAFIESTRAKMRFFQLPSLLGGAFVLALLSLLSYVMMGK
jgi:formate hydrogenlyase subunit 4